MTNLLHRNDRFVTVHNKYSKIPPSATLNYNELWLSGAKTVCCSSELIFTFLYTGSIYSGQ
jgi:hypothetical protein